MEISVFRVKLRNIAEPYLFIGACLKKNPFQLRKTNVFDVAQIKRLNYVTKKTNITSVT
jgi:hypothetical protein